MFGTLRCEGKYHWDDETQRVIVTQLRCDYQQAGRLTDKRVCPVCGGELLFASHVMRYSAQGKCPATLRGVRVMSDCMHELADDDEDDNSDLCEECATSDGPLCDDSDCDFANPPEEPKQ